MHPLCQDIENGLLDNELVAIERAVKNRRQLSALTEVGFQPGDVCRFTYQTSPKYLNTHGVEVLYANSNGDIIVKALAPRAHGRRFRVRPSSLEKVAA